MNIHQPSNKIKKPVIVLVEDDPSFGMLIKYRLNNSGFETHVAKDGLEAIEMIFNLDPSLIICDIMMPYISGLEIVERVRKENNQTPIILISSAGKIEMTLKAFELGANDFLIKPFIINELLVTINKLL
jgi:DNA-binding response OmpR family regulator